MTRTPARLHPYTGEGGLAGDSTRRAFLKGASVRGVQLTGTTGWARFETIDPGWYQGRATRIHVKVHVAGSSIVRLTAVKRDTAAKGYHGSIILGTDPRATPGAVGR